MLGLALALPGLAGAESPSGESAEAHYHPDSGPNIAYDAKDWKETEVPPPPAFDTRHLVPLTMPVYMTLHYGVDPATLTLDRKDGVVRYVVVASRPDGPLSAVYEGVRCATGETRLYARFNEPGPWEPATSTEWKPIGDNQTSAARAMARQGICVGAGARNSVAEIVYRLKKPFDPSLPD